MKKVLLCVSLYLASLAGIAQTAVNFNCSDCASVPHDFFSELDAGKVIVLDWVMPCSGCVAASLTTYNIVQSYQLSNPNVVQMYLCDDYGNTSCALLYNWAANNNLDNVSVFSNASINMLDYGSAGMPKIVVVGGANHTVFYNANITVNATALQNAIDAALSTGINQPAGADASLNIFPNPVAGNAEIKFNLEKSSDVTIELFNLEGQRVQNLFSGKLSMGENKLKVDFSNYDLGMYLVKFREGDKNRFMNVVVSR